MFQIHFYIFHSFVSLCPTKRLHCLILFFTIHLPQRSSKFLLGRITANRNALLFETRVTCFDRKTMGIVVACSDQKTVNNCFTLSTFTLFEWFQHHTQMEASFGVILLTMCVKILYWFRLFSNYNQ